MYIPASFDCNDADAIRDLLVDNAFGILVSSDDTGQSIASHLPFVPRFDEQGRLFQLGGHLARANPQACGLSKPGQSLLAIFQGPHAYVSPRHYDADFAVPTWNYAVVHVIGAVTVHTDAQATRTLLDELVTCYEPEQDGWQADWQDERADGLLKAIVGFDIDVTRVEAKFKLNQNRSDADQRSVAAALLDSKRESDRQAGQLMLNLLAS